MNRQQRRRQAAMAKQNKFFTEYVQHLPEVGPETIGKPGRVCHMVCYITKTARSTTARAATVIQM